MTILAVKGCGVNLKVFNQFEMYTVTEMGTAQREIKTNRELCNLNAGKRVLGRRNLKLNARLTGYHEFSRNPMGDVVINWAIDYSNLYFFIRYI